MFLFDFLSFFNFFFRRLVSGQKLLNALSNCLEIFTVCLKYLVTAPYCFSAQSHFQDGRQRPFCYKFAKMLCIARFRTIELVLYCIVLNFLTVTDVTF